jgi:hypothetical protein
VTNFRVKKTDITLDIRVTISFFFISSSRLYIGVLLIQQYTRSKFVDEKGMDSTSKVDVESDAVTLLTSVFSALADQADKDVFAIGGKFNMGNPTSASTGNKDSVVIRWDSSQGSKVVLPINGDTASERAFAQLLNDCEPATFGRSDQEVYDEMYRKARKMDEAKFCTNFNPSEYGVIDTVVQALAHDNHADGRFRGVRAELYSLNVSPLSSMYSMAI